MANSKNGKDSDNTIVTENQELRSGDQSSDIRNGKSDDAGDTALPDHGAETIAEGNQELREDESSDGGSKGRE